MQNGQTGVQAGYNRLVADAATVGHFETVFVPGLLQTGAYARRVLQEMRQLHGLGIDDVDGAVAMRLARQVQLDDETKRFEFLIAEPVLHWWLCPAGYMQAQFDRLFVESMRRNVRFGVLPHRRLLATIPQNSFQMYDDLVLVETFDGEVAHPAGSDGAAKYAQVWQLLWADAVEGDEARQLVSKAAAAAREAAL